MSHYSDARAVIAGGVNSPVRAFAGVGGEPVFFRSAAGAWVESEDGRRFIDYVGSWGPMISWSQPPRRSRRCDRYGPARAQLRARLAFSRPA